MKKELILGIILIMGFSIFGFAQKKEQHVMKGMDMNMNNDTTKAKKAVNRSVKKPASKPAMQNMDHMHGMDTVNANAMDTMKMDNHNVHSMDGMNMSGMDMMSDTSKKSKQATDSMNMQDHSNMNHADMNMSEHMDMNHMEGMSHAYSLNLPMGRNGSGTAWLPDASPMYGYMFHKNKWMYMLHGNLFLRYNSQDFTNKGSRGNSKFDAPDWVMFMGQRQAGKNGLFHFSTMFSSDAAIAGGSGYPLLFQSGEAYKGKSIVDRQHPHDLFSELSVSYSQALSKKADVFAYVGYPGEPALGPVAFMHRPSALDNPDAPISHHWVDATHITFGVATLGVRYGGFKIEGSSFTGREPDENRYNFDKPLFNSWSSRLSYNPSQNWALQVSHGFIKSPELLHPAEDIHRTTASAIYSLPMANNGTFNATAIWGLNKTKDNTGENAFLLEGSWRKGKTALHARYEFTQKSAEELSLDEMAFGQHAVFPVNAFTAGFNYDLLRFGQTRLAGGSQFTLYHADSKLNSLYGKNPMAFEVYLRLYPGMMNMKM